ncbi:hypothetical protein [Streptomyces sp. YIM B13502]|uniref:hypothetical protein n=1 Tax=Streptomyces sp. YIM B13502 TaxID=3366317 RepID=UPI003695C0AB
MIDDNGIRLGSRIKTALNLGLAGNGVSLVGRDQENTTFDVAEKLKKKLRKSVITDFSTPASGRLIQGAGHTEVAEFQMWGYPQHRLRQRTAVIHTQAVTREGRVDLCLFGSLKNLRGFAVPEEDPVGGWTSSAAPMIEEFIALRGAEVSTGTGREFPFDEEQLAVEILKVALSQGIYADPSDHLGRPETRAYTMLGCDATEYVALIYRDVVLTAGRWDFRVEPELEGVHRILIGAPLWMRTTRQDSVRRHFGENRVVIPRALGASSTSAIAPSQETPHGHGHVILQPSRDGEHTQN